ncbi:MAG: four helix bundle protein [Phascolarctobacterium sp.]|nr:four helix bundle protein [Candidatus Phascolarctobacterium caballi]
MMKGELEELSFKFSVEILRFSKYLRMNKEYIVADQIGRAGTSVGANIREAHYAQSKLDFINKLSIALKEANETEYWLELAE